MSPGGSQNRLLLCELPLIGPCPAGAGCAQRRPLSAAVPMLAPCHLPMMLAVLHDLLYWLKMSQKASAFSFFAQLARPLTQHHCPCHMACLRWLGAGETGILDSAWILPAAQNTQLLLAERDLRIICGMLLLCVQKQHGAPTRAPSHGGVTTRGSASSAWDCRGDSRC